MKNIDVIPGEICGGMPGTIPKEIILENSGRNPTGIPDGILK